MERLECLMNQLKELELTQVPNVRLNDNERDDLKQMIQEVYQEYDELKERYNRVMG